MSWASTLCVLTHYLVAHRVDKLVCFEGKINMNSAVCVFLTDFTFFVKFRLFFTKKGKIRQKYLSTETEITQPMHKLHS